ncbi:macro domain-containing protein [Mucilaginibacter sp. Bleaf8]|uniref:macro domain-containing protein n=1 Tax=Mucilaginibacter sp. Bleaf8 TaxID=2834430 RepID=UPI001BCC9485|nr:macro domain-containing protein [Mucilaginibacter sp. Bleaf8]MBS7565904.1 macro domain-containing protein [Mucilaginibacter sp. Bleaf8]
MITYTKGDLLDAQVDALVNAVNTVGVMGKGIALQFKNRFPENFKAYKDAVSNGILVTGKVQVVPVNSSTGVKYIVNFPTKQHWRNPSKLIWVEEGLTDLVTQIKVYDIQSIAIPPLGCGNGGLDWGTVKPLIENALAGLNINVVIYEPLQNL